MKSYAEREVIYPRHLELFKKASELVAALDTLPEPIQEAVRCHELTRAVARILDIPRSVRDGTCAQIQHSWIELLDKKGLLEVHRAILDVYVPGRVPQVQLIHWTWVTGEDKRYRASTLEEMGIRIDENMVDSLVAAMEASRRRG